jgi:hypothetical protein
MKKSIFNINFRISRYNNCFVAFSSLLQGELNDLSLDKKIIYDVNGNKLSDEDLKNFKKGAMTLYKKAYFSKENGKVNIEIVRR